MRRDWNIDGKKGNVWFPKGEVVYQHPKGRVVIEPIYQTEDGKRYIEVSPGKLQEVLTNPFNGYCYRQDGE
jgi:hypothetical protein